VLLVPLKVRVPPPRILREPVPEIVPLKVEEECPSRVRVPLPKVTDPDPAKEPMALLKLFRFNIPLDSIIILEEEEKLLVAPACKVPAVAPPIVVAPE
jgi:hypothetical protein